MKNIDDIFKQSFERALGSGGFNNDFVEHFYVNFIGQSEEIAEMFKNTNMSVQKTMLHDSLYLVVDYYNSGKVTDGMKRIAEVHSRRDKNIAPRLYEFWLDSLIKTVETLDSDYDQEVEQAWRHVLAPGISYMQSKY